jgi:hypothetical protein
VGISPADSVRLTSKYRVNGPVCRPQKMKRPRPRLGVAARQFIDVAEQKKPLGSFLKPFISG